MGLVGRDDALAILDDAFREGDHGLTIVLLEGDAGIGKTAVLRDVVDRSPGTTLTARPVEAEFSLSFAALGDLLAGAPADALAGLPGAQQAALDTVLLRGPRVSGPVEPRVIGTAVHSVMTRLAGIGQVTVAIDDLQWIDAASQAALAFALRRVQHLPICVLAAVRVGEGATIDPFGLERSLVHPLRRIRLGPLTVSALFHVIRDRTGLVFPRPALLRIAETSGGNPLFAIELARALAEIGTLPAPGQPLPVPGSLASLIDARLAASPAEWTDTLLTIALMREPTAAQLEQVVEGCAAIIDDAIRAQLLEVSAGCVRFAHPLIAAAVVGRADADHRRRIHRELAACAGNDEERARHLALSARGPDERVAAALEDAAADAARRGAPHAAADLMQLSLAATEPSDVERVFGRQTKLAELALRAGDAVEARRLVTDVVDRAGRGAALARALELDAHLLHVMGSSEEATARCDAALEMVSADDPHLLARLHATRAGVEYHDVAVAGHHARRALDILDVLETPDPSVYAQAVMALAGAEIELGHPIPFDLIERGMAFERLHPSPNVSDRLGPSLGTWLKYAGRLSEARVLLLDALRAAIDEGDEGSMPYALSHLPQLELWAGDWPAAERYAMDHLAAAERTGQEGQRASALYNLGDVHAHQGRFEQARAELDQAFAACEAMGDRWTVMPLSAALGFLHLAAGDDPAAVEALRRSEELNRDFGRGLPRRATANYAEALVRTGDLEAARRVIADFERSARRLDLAELIASALRCRAMLAAAEQCLDDAAQMLDGALLEHQRSEEPFSLARTLLLQGQVRRRRGERRGALESLDDAQSTFARLGAPTWVARAAQERGRVPVRRGSGNDLTAAELHVAAMAARGSTNQEIGGALFISVKTVESNLTRVYAKLGIRSRAELAARFAETDGARSANS